MFRNAVKKDSTKGSKNHHGLKYQIFPGNNGALVKRVMAQGCPKRAMMWFETNNLQQSYFHFRWAPLSR